MFGNFGRPACVPPPVASPATVHPNKPRNARLVMTNLPSPDNESIIPLLSPLCKTTLAFAPLKDNIPGGDRVKKLGD